jgi:hypothetical protein
MRAGASVTRLIQPLRSEDTAVRDMAAPLIWQRYIPDLLDLARKNLDRRVRRRADEEDVLQRMFRSFCARQGRGQFELAGRDELWLEGYTNREIADQLDCTERSIEQRLERIRSKWMSYDDNPPSARKRTAQCARRRVLDFAAGAWRASLDAAETVDRWSPS